MCNRARNKASPDQIQFEFSQARIPLRFPEGPPNLRPGDFAITDTAAIVRAGADGAELVARRWSWPGPTGKPVYNFRSEGRDLSRGRCLIPVDGFYEYTAPADPKAKRKDRWLFTRAGEPTEPDPKLLPGEAAPALFCIAGLWRTWARNGEGGEAFTMLTIEPGPDVAPFHHRQVAVLDRGDWARWLDPAVPAAELLGPLPAGSLAAERA
jgi:putative SOS response-associated peptidase YedK